MLFVSFTTKFITMKKVFFWAALGFTAIGSAAYTVQSIINWKILNEKTQVKFIMQAHGQELAGSFTGVKGDVKFDAADMDNSSFDCTIDVSTIKTGMEQRDGHLQAKGWFDAAGSPAIRFTSSKIVKGDDGYTATGTLNMKGTSKELMIPFTFEGSGTTGLFKGSFVVKRGDFGIGKTDGDISNEVTIMLEIPVEKN